MRLTHLALVDWRNIAAQSLDTDARFVVLHGDNGQGKTNLLEAVWMLATLRSFRESRPARLVRHGAQTARLEGTVTGLSGRRKLGWTREDGRRKLWVDGQSTADLEAWFSVLRAVLFCPEHIGIVREGPDQRRAFLDRAAFTTRPSHLDVVRRYRRVLRHKAALLRGPGTPPKAQVATWNLQLTQMGAELAVRRADVLSKLAGPFSASYRAIAGHRAGTPTLRTQGVGRVRAGESLDRAQVASALADKLDASIDEELRQGRCLVGPHRDELVIELDGHVARRFASQGQARSLVLALKLAELAAARSGGATPLFLLDDLTSELDRGRMSRLMELLTGLDHQVWLTTTDPRWLGPLSGGDVWVHQLDSGAVAASNHGALSHQDAL